MFFPSDKITIQLKKGDIEYHYVSLRSKVNLKFFPKDSIGGSNKNNPGKLFSIYLEGLNEYVQTDIDKGKNFFRDRSFPPRFINYHQLKVGDKIIIENLSEYQYKIYPQSLSSRLAANNLLEENKEIDRILIELDSQGFFNPANRDGAIKKNPSFYY